MIWVDDMRRSARPANYRGHGIPRWSHLFAETPAELAAFARQLGLSPAWLQYAGTHREHYDVTDTVRRRAVQAGAVPLRYPAGVADLLEARRAVCRCSTLAACRWGSAVAAPVDCWPGFDR